MSVAPDGSAVFVTGASTVGSDADKYATVAYRASDGARLWVSIYGLVNGIANAIVSPGGNKVFVTGVVSASDPESGKYATVAYNATTGARLWARTYSAYYARASSMAVSPDRTKVYVTGEKVIRRDSKYTGVYYTVAYKAASGAQVWARQGSPGTHSRASSVAVSPAGTVVVTGSSQGDYATVAYSAAGRQLWAKRYNGPANGPDAAVSVASPGNGKVYVTGHSSGGRTRSSDYATIAYNLRTGAQLWVKRYNGPASGPDSASSLTARSGRVYVTGGSQGTTTGQDTPPSLTTAERTPKQPLRSIRPAGQRPPGGA